MGWAQFSICPFFFLSVTRHKHLLSQIVIRTLSHATCDAHSLKAVNVWEMLWILFTLLCVKYIFLWFYHSVSHGMRWRCSFYFPYMTNKMVLTLEVWFPRSDGHLQFVYISCGLGNWSEFCGCFIESSSEIWRKIKYLSRDKQERAPPWSWYMSIFSEISTTVLTLAVDSLNLRLCDSCDYLLNFKS